MVDDLSINYIITKLIPKSLKISPTIHLEWVYSTWLDFGWKSLVV
jgi:hypothetical protein